MSLRGWEKDGELYFTFLHIRVCDGDGCRKMCYLPCETNEGESDERAVRNWESAFEI